MILALSPLLAALMVFGLNPQEPVVIERHLSGTVTVLGPPPISHLPFVQVFSWSRTGPTDETGKPTDVPSFRTGSDMQGVYRLKLIEQDAVRLSFVLSGYTCLPLKHVVPLASGITKYDVAMYPISPASGEVAAIAGSLAEYMTRTAPHQERSLAAAWIELEDSTWTTEGKVLVAKTLGQQGFNPPVSTAGHFKAFAQADAMIVRKVENQITNYIMAPLTVKSFDMEGVYKVDDVVWYDVGFGLGARYPRRTTSPSLLDLKVQHKAFGNKILTGYQEGQRVTKDLK